VSKTERTKGLRGELEVRKEFERAGFSVRGLEGQGDNLVVCADDLLLHLETKRREVVRILEWSRQAEREAPVQAMPLVCFRPSREPWRVSLLLTDFLAMLRRVP
jgi:hypothetical protein